MKARVFRDVKTNQHWVVDGLYPDVETGRVVVAFSSLVFQGRSRWCCPLDAWKAAVEAGRIVQSEIEGYPPRR